MTDDQPGSVPPNEPQGTTKPDSAGAGQPVPPTQPAFSPDLYAQPAPQGQPTYGPPQGQPAYGQPAYGQPVYGQPVRPTGTDGMSIAALVTGILGCGLVAVVLGIFGIKRTKANGTSGRVMAIVGIVLGSLTTITAIIIGIVIAVSAPAIVDKINEVAASASAAAEVMPTPTADATDDTALSLTPLKDIVPLSVGGFAAPALADEPSLLSTGALEAYTATYTDGTSSVAAVLTDWTTADEALAYVNAQKASFTADQMYDSKASDDGTSTYWAYDANGVTTVIEISTTAALTMSGPEDAVIAVFNGFPL